ncbi:histo-blood group ABO system transferase 2-like isoform X28 [Chrysemys picta bellii]|uniref:histo-blood group ABO system transferase 2-like isoform X28 n=1 Tax=Chrysemys picta bellii TaxID=8478 RepID=UPI0032B24C76
MDIKKVHIVIPIVMAGIIGYFGTEIMDIKKVHILIPIVMAGIIGYLGTKIMDIKEVHILIPIVMAGIIGYLGQVDLDETSLVISRIPHISRPSSQPVRQVDLDETSLVISRMSYPQPFVDKPQRTDVLLMSPWLAPIMWEGTFNRDILNAQYRQKKFVVGVATFAVKKYVRFIEGFLGSANKFFLSGHRVNFYLFTDHPEKVPSMKLAPEKSLFIIPVQNYSRWQDISMNRMDIISNRIRTHWHYEVDYLYSMDIDVQMFEHIGVEIIDTLVGTISSWQYTKPRDSNSYERRPESRAAIPSGEGDFYYAASFYGGSVSEVYKLTTACFKGVTEDRANGIEAKWHEESHLNKYLLYHKPTRLLSPEYYWDEELPRPQIIRVKRLSSVRKDLEEVRS